MVIIKEASCNPIILNEYTSNKEFKSNKQKIDNIRRSSRNIDSEEKLNDFLKNNSKNINEIIAKSKQKKQIDTKDRLAITKFISLIGMAVGARIAADSDNAKPGLIITLISGISLAIQVVISSVKNILQKNDANDINNMQIFCDKMKDNLTKYIKDPYDIKDPKLRNKYLELLHELDVSSDSLYKATHKYTTYNRNLDSDKIASEEEIKLRTDAINDMLNKIKHYIINTKYININRNEDIRNFVSGYINSATFYFTVNSSYDDNDIVDDVRIQRVISINNKIKSAIDSISNDKIGFKVEFDVDSNTSDDELEELYDNYYMDDINSGTVHIYRKKEN